MTRRNGQDRGDGAYLGILRINLSDTAAVVREHAVLRRRQNKLRFAGVGKHGRGCRYQWRRRQVAAGDELLHQIAAQIVFGEPRRASEKKMLLKSRGLEEHRRRAERFKSCINRCGKRVRLKTY